MVEFTGFTNPVRAAKAAIAAMGVPMDEESFDALADERGDASPSQLADGFIISDMDDLHHLCQLGGFTVFVHAGTGLLTATANIPTEAQRD